MKTVAEKLVPGRDRVDHPYDNGYWAFFDGKKHDQNPYSRGTSENKEWDRGWWCACTE